VKLLEVLKERGLDPKIHALLRKLYTDNQVRFVLNDLETDWIKIDGEVRQGCPLSAVLFNIYMADVAKVIEDSLDGVDIRKYSRNGPEEKMVISGLLYADDICLLSREAHGLQNILNRVNLVLDEYGLRINRKKSMVVRVGGPFGGGEWYAGEEKIVEKKETRYLGMKIVG
jgi:hypothetical protein